jgi:hypothetical protein
MNHPFSNIVSFNKRAIHFAGGEYAPCPEWSWRALIPKDDHNPLSIIVENYEYMKPTDKDWYGWVEWLDAVARTLGRWLDDNKANIYFRYACRWWQECLFFKPSPDLLNIKSLDNRVK